MENLTTTNEHDNPSTALSAISGIAGFATFIATFGVTSYFGFQAMIPFLAGGAVGLVAGLISARIASRRGRTTLANVSVVLCIVAGGIGGILLAGPVAFLFIAITLLMAPKSRPDDQPVNAISNESANHTIKK